MNSYYRDYSDYLADTFGPGKIQKLTVNTRLGCPNRDGTIGRGGCIYCNNTAFSPEMGVGDDIVDQLEASRCFFGRKYSDMRYLAYFQSYTNTYGDMDRLMSMYRRALEVDDVIGLIIGTRPDCMPDELLKELAILNGGAKRVIIEYGAESSHDETLARINRCHTWAVTEDAVMRTSDAGIDVGLHFILGLPGETEPMILKTIERINTLPVSTVKFHQLQVVRGTLLARMYESGGLQGCGMMELTVEKYLDLCATIIGRLRKDIAIERFVSQSPADLLMYPRWGLKNYQFTHRLLGILASRR